MDRKMRLATLSPSVIADLLFGEEAAATNTSWMGRLIRTFKRLPVGGLGSAHGRFPHHGPARRAVDPALQPVQVRRTCRHQGGHPHLLRGVRGLPAPPGTPASSSSPRSLQGKILCNTTRRRRYWRPRLQGPAAGSGFRITLPRTGIPVSPASPPPPSGTPPWTGSTCLPPSEGEPGLVIVVDDFCTRGATLADIARAVRESNPGWKVQGASLAKAERAAYWNGELTNAHIPDYLDANWRGDPEAASPWY